MIPILQSTKNSRWTCSLKSRSSSMNGTGSFLSLTLNTDTLLKSNRFHAVRNVIFPKTAPALPVALHSLIFTAIMAKPGSSNAKSAIQTSPRMRTALQSSLPCTAPTVGKHSWQKKSGNTLFSINVSTRNVLTISTI